jgi:Uma2 family endonuclease
VVAAASLPISTASREQRMLILGVTWKDYMILREALDTPGLRMTYLKGALELMSPSKAHERKKTTIARLIELYAYLMRLPLNGYGSTTFRRQAKERGAEPDECWCLGRVMPDDGMPEIVLEVIETSPLLDKLTVYDGFEVPEVWLFEDGVFSLHGRRKSGGYERMRKSRLLPTLDFGLVARFAHREDQQAALEEFAAALRRKAKRSKKQK